MYFSSGNYEAFARPKKPADVDNKHAYIIGTGLAALSAACYLVRDGQMPGENIHILEKDPVPGGACDGLEKIVEQRISAGSIGFNAEVVNRKEMDIDELLRKVEPQDLTKFGLIPECIGRVPVEVSLEQLTKEAMVRILSEPKNALTKQYQKLFELDNVKLEFTKEALEEIARLAVERKIGARGLRSILESAIMDLMYEIPSDDSIGICTITKAVIDKTGEPEFVYRDMQPSARKPLSERIRGGRNGEIA